MAVIGLVAWRLFAVTGGAPSGDRAGRYALAAEDLTALAGDRWQVTPLRVNIDLAERAAAGIAPVPDDRHAIAWRAAGSGAEVTQITLLYDRPGDAEDLLAGKAAALLADHFGLVAEPAVVDGADEAARWRGPEWRAASVRRGGVVAFVATVGGAAPDPLALAERVVARVVAEPPASPTP